jgi:hypothetical protein
MTSKTSRRSSDFDADGMKAPHDLRRLCIKIANQAGKGHWWNAMAAATALVALCQKGCRTEVERVAKKRARETRGRRTSGRG